MIETEPTDLIVAGLGNPGPEYSGTRHNLGVLCVEALGRRLGIQMSSRRWHALVGRGPAPPGSPLAVSRLWLLWPQTYMNESGRSVREALKDLALEPERVWVVHDELDLPLCRLRIRRGGSAAGHNGVQSVMSCLKSPDFARFRVGIGRPPDGMDPIRYVLTRFGRAEASRLEAVVDGVASALEEALRSGLERAMDTYNRSGSLGCEELP